MLPRAIKTQLALLSLCGALCAAQGTAMWLEVPFVRQEKNGCGAASIAMVMEYWRQQPGQNSSSGPMPEQILRDLYSAEARGIYASEMERYFRQHGFQAFAFQGQWNDLAQHLGKGRPLIVALEPGRGTPRHYVVVAGVDPEQKVVLTNDPAERKLLKRTRSDFEQEWKAAGNWTLLAVPQASERSSAR
jgi:ABC-type bacteriocin/lantibiotic exporter with double-glycine peptidase domain